MRIFLQSHSSHQKKPLTEVELDLPHQRKRRNISPENPNQGLNNKHLKKLLKNLIMKLHRQEALDWHEAEPLQPTEISRRKNQF